ncbi:alpha/beta fold hydrolase [Paenibacillus sp. GCM10027626]|uniref:alpha/beta fold hydrolase n=1 Tax=Paenibacillus sp. GCM10027626 TaxID=3273411 RepID=UPI00362FA1BB
MVNVFKSEAGQQQVITSYDRLLKRWPVAIQEVDIDTSYGTTHCIVAGNPGNPPLILLHGVGDNSAVMWALNIEALAAHFYCIAVDTLGGPGKSRPNEHFHKKTFRQLQWLEEVIAHFTAEKVYMAGVSNGAYMAYNYAAANPGKVARVVCLEGGMVIKPFKAMLQTLLLMFPELLNPTEENLLKVLKKMSHPDSGMLEEHPWVAEHLVLLMKHHNQQAMFVHQLKKYDHMQGLAARDKLYFLIADHRLKSKKDFMRIMQHGMYRYKIIPQAGHGINHEQPATINHEMLDFLLQDIEASNMADSCRTS